MRSGGTAPAVARRLAAVAGLALIGAVVVACGGSPEDTRGGDTSAASPTGTSGTQADGQRFPDVVDASVTRTGETYQFDVTISSPYDSPDRYADGWRVKGADGTVFGVHELGHDHASEQPFTRTQTGVSIPGNVDEVIVEGRDLRNGFGGETETVTLP